MFLVMQSKGIILVYFGRISSRCISVFISMQHPRAFRLHSGVFRCIPVYFAIYTDPEAGLELAVLEERDT